MLASQIHLGKASLLQPKSKIRLECGASVNILADASLTNSSAVSSPSIFKSDHWARARYAFLISFTVSFAENISIDSRRLFIQQFGQTISGAKLFHQLQLQTELKGQITVTAACLREPVRFNLELRRQVQPYHNQHAENESHQPQILSGIENVKQPLGVPTVVLCSVNVSLTFSQWPSAVLVPQKRRRPASNGYLDPWEELPHAGDCTLGTAPYAQQQDIYREQYAHTRHSPTRTSTNYLLGTKEVTPNVFDQADPVDNLKDSYCGVREYETDDAESLVFSSQGSTLQQSQENPFCPASEPASAPDVDAMITLIDAGFRNLICPKPIGTAPGIKVDELNIGMPLVDVAPSVFSPGYSTAVATRASLVPTVARFLTSFVQKVDSPPGRTKKVDIVRQFSNIKFEAGVDETAEQPNEREKLKVVIKTHLWMTMSNGLRDHEPARRLQALHGSTRQSFRHKDILIDKEEDGSPGQRFENFVYHDVLESDRSAQSGPSLEEKATHDDMLDFSGHHQADTDSEIMLDCYEEEEDDDDELEEYEPDLFEVYEANLMNHLSTAITPGSEPLYNMGQQQSTAEKPPTSLGTAHYLSSPMLEYPAASSEASVTVQTACESLPARFELDLPITSTPPPLLDSSNVDDEATSQYQVLDEDEEPGGSSKTAGGETRERVMLAQTGCSKTDNNVGELEPDFEQWEFDVEAGCDDLLF